MIHLGPIYFKIRKSEHKGMLMKVKACGWIECVSKFKNDCCSKLQEHKTPAITTGISHNSGI